VNGTHKRIEGDALPTLPRAIFNADHDAFRHSVRRFLDAEVRPHFARWEAAGQVDHSVWLKAGENGLLCMTMPETYGGAGVDRLFSAVLIEEIVGGGFLGLFFALHSDIIAPYIFNHGTEEQKRRWLPRMATGELIGAIAMTEPGAGSDLQGIRTTAVREGDTYRLNGSKIFISNGRTAGLIIVAAKTEGPERGKGVSLLVLEGDPPGFTRGPPLRKVGLHAQDTCELFFDDVCVPEANLLGGEGQGFSILMRELAWERMQIGISAMALAEAALRWTVDHTKARKAFGKTIFDFQNTRFRLAELATEVQLGRVFVDRCLQCVLRDELTTATAAMVKYWTSDLTMRLLDRCVQLHGGYGFMLDYDIGRAFANYRFQPIAGGSNEIMKDLIARSL
jgi:alkylation response protein AidB-like acyl-CoA dehydrogenase